MIYFLGIKGMRCIKIGTSTNVHQRVKAHESHYKSKARILGVHAGDRDVEASIHCMFDHLLLKGHREWFKPGRDLIRYIRERTAPLDRIDEIEDVTNGVFFYGRGASWLEKAATHAGFSGYLEFVDSAIVHLASLNGFPACEPDPRHPKKEQPRPVESSYVGDGVIQPEWQQGYY